MKIHSVGTQLCSLLLALIFVGSCHGQHNLPPTDSIRYATATGQPKVIKNRFITRYPQTFWFVQCGLQDKAGNLWFGTTADALYCYDGKSFTNFTVKDGLCHNDVLCMMEDNAENIWFGTRNGLCRYQVGSKSFTSFPIRRPSNFVWSILQDNTGRIWFGTNEGVFFYTPSANQATDTPSFTHFLDNENLVNTNHLRLEMIQSMVEDLDGNIWFASGYFEGEGICFYDGKSITSLKPEGVRDFRKIIKAKSGNLLFLTNRNQGVFEYDIHQNSQAGQEKTFTNFTRKIGLTNDTITALLEDKTGNIWFGMSSEQIENGGGGGVWRYSPSASSGQVTSAPLHSREKALKLFTTKDGLSHNGVFCMVEDRDGNIWFGTRNTGLCCYKRSDSTGSRSFTDFTE